MKDKNGIETKHKDIVKIINNPFFGKNISIKAIKEGMDEGKLQQVVYNPNCCKVCRQTESVWGCYGNIEEILQDGEFEIIGNLDTTPELLPLKI